MTTVDNSILTSLQQKAEAGDAQAQFEMARISMFDSEWLSINEKMFDMLEKSADKGCLDAQLCLGVFYLTIPETDNKFVVGKISNEKKNGLDNTPIGLAYNMYLFSPLDGGILIKKLNQRDTHHLAFMWLKKAADQGNPDAQFWLGYCFYHGIGVDQNYELAFASFTESAAQNMSDSMYWLARCYFDGSGVIQNYTVALDWLIKSVETGCNEGFILLADLYRQGKCVNQNAERAFKCYKKSLDHENPRVEYALAKMCLSGKGLDKNYKNGMEYMVSAAIKGNVDAYNWLTNALLDLVIPTVLLNKDNTEHYYQFIFHHCKKGLHEPDAAVAYLFLGVLYATGKGVEQNDKLAFENFQRALKAPYFDEYGNDSDEDTFFLEFIRLYLSVCYAQGKGVEKDLKKADDYQTFELEDLGKSFMEGIEPSPIFYFQVARIFMINLKTNIFLEGKKYDLARKFIQEVFKNTYGFDSGHKRVYLSLIQQREDLDKKNKELISEIKLKEDAHKALHEKEKEMLSFFTHTMRNALATAPESLRQAIHLLGSDVYEKDVNHYKAINKIASLFSSLSLTDCLIDTFKQSISDPDEFRQTWQKDHRGDATPQWVIASSLRQSLNRIIFMSDASDLKKLLNYPETTLIKATRKSFIEEILPLNVDDQGVNLFYEWIKQHIPCLDVTITDTDDLNFGVNQTRFSLLFSITSELILNALKYWNGEHNIQISWQLKGADHYVFCVKNHCETNASSNLAGTHTGLAFINRLIELLGNQARFSCKTDERLFTAELTLNKTLFGSK